MLLSENVSDLAVIALENLERHPKNPRKFPREDVIDGIAARITEKGKFEERYALHVRRLESGKYQIISGHHRAEAAKRAGLKEVPCYVVTMTDEEAIFELLFANTQGELSNLETGMHVLEEICKGKPGRGNKGGVAQCARGKGMPQQTLDRWVQAAAVAKTYSPWVDLIPYSTTSLSIIHRAPESNWPDLVKRMLAEKWTKGQTLRHVDAITIRQVKDPHWHCGDWRNYIDTLKDDSVALLLLDPPYDGDDPAKEISACLEAMFPKLKSDTHVLIFRRPKYEAGVHPPAGAVPETDAAVRNALLDCGYGLFDFYVWIHGADPDEPGTDFLSACQCIFDAVKGNEPLLSPRWGEGFTVPRLTAPIHPAEKPVALLHQLIDATTVKGDLVADPFAGVASTLVAAKQSNRNYWGCEIEEEYYRAGAARLSGVEQISSGKEAGEVFSAVG